MDKNAAIPRMMSQYITVECLIWSSDYGKVFKYLERNLKLGGHLVLCLSVRPYITLLKPFISFEPCMLESLNFI